MRLIGTLVDARQAELFAAWMVAEGMAVHLEPAGDGFEVWIRQEDQTVRARAELAAFQQNPLDPKFPGAAARAAEVERDRLRRQKAFEKNVVHGARTRGQGKSSPLIVLLIVICGVVALLTNFGNGNVAQMPAFQALNFNWTQPPQSTELFRQYGENPDALPLRLASILRGEVWRIFTPMFIHFGTTHLIFNMLMLFQLGRIVEWRYGTVWLAPLVLFTAAASHLAEGLVPGSLRSAPLQVTPELIAVYFGGMSGVVYGLFGFLWVKSVFDPASGIRLAPSTIVIMVVWLLLCMSPLGEQLIGRVANWAHGAGLASGMLAGLVPLLWKKRT